MFMQIADLRLSVLCPYVLAPLYFCALISAPLCPLPLSLRPYVGFYSMDILDFVADKQQDVYVNACSGVGLGRTFS